MRNYNILEKIKRGGKGQRRFWLTDENTELDLNKEDMKLD